MPDLPVVDPVLIMTVAVLAFLVAPFVSRRTGLPGLVVVILLGALVGPAGAGVLARDETIVLLGTVGLLYLLFVAGLELDLGGFLRHPRRTLTFGALSFLVPLVLALVVAPRFGFDTLATVMVGAIVASHTLLAYPIAARLGIARDPAVTTVVGGSLLTDTLSLGLLAVVGGLAAGDVGPAYWARLVGFLALYVLAVTVLLPRVSRWFFRLTDAEATVRYVFLLAAMFLSAGLAEAAGAQPIIGAFLAGLAINRLVPQGSTMMARVKFVGEAFFVPFFLLSVGMLVDVRVLFSPGAFWLIVMFVGLVVVGKGGAALLAQRALGFDAPRGTLMAGLSIPQAAATLAVTFVGLELGLFDATVVNAVIGLILVSVVLGAVLVQRGGRAVALASSTGTGGDGVPGRTLVPLANPGTAERLLDLAFLLRPAGSQEAVYPLTVVMDEGSVDAEVAAAERVLAHAVVYAAEAEVPVLPLTRVAVNPASGIAAAVRERRITDVVIGWYGASAAQRAVFGSVIDQVIESSDVQVIVCRLHAPIATTRAMYVVVPPAVDVLTGFGHAAWTVTTVARQLGATVQLLATGSDVDRLAARMREAHGGVPVVSSSHAGWPALLAHLRELARPDDLVVVIGARKGTVAWRAALDRLPTQLADLGSNFVALYPSERLVDADEAAGAAVLRALRPERVTMRLAAPDVAGAIAETLAPLLAPGDRRAPALLRALVREDVGYASEALPDTMLVHARTRAVAEPRVAIGLRPGGFEDAPRAVERVVVLLSGGDEDVGAHLARLSRLVQRLHEVPVAELLDRASAEDVVAALHAEERPA